MSEARKVAVCMVTHDSAADLPECLAAVGRIEHRPLEVVIVDCASGDDSAEVAERHLPRDLSAAVVPLAENLGFAGGMNRAIAATDAAFVFCLNPDARPGPQALGHLLRRMNAHPELRVGAVTGRLIRPRDGDGPAILDACGMRLTPSWRHLDRGSDRVDRGQWMIPERVFGATGAASLFRREALADAAVDGEIFAEEFHSFREDAELCFRLRERGWEVLYEPSARIVHRRANLPRRRRRMPARVNLDSLKNRYLLRIYHQTAINLLLTLPAAVGRDLLALLYVLTRETASLGAYRWLWRHRRRILRRRRRIQERRLCSAGEIERWFWRRGLPL